MGFDGIFDFNLKYQIYFFVGKWEYPLKIRRHLFLGDNSMLSQIFHFSENPMNKNGD